MGDRRDVHAESRCGQLDGRPAGRGDRPEPRRTRQPGSHRRGTRSSAHTPTGSTGLAYRLSGNRSDAEDLTQETFVRVFRSLADYTPGTFEGWLHRITTNLFLDMVRRRQKIRFDALAEDASERLASDEPGPERAYEQNNLDPEVQRALDALLADFRAAVVLCDLEGLTYEEIALTLDIKVGTVRSRIHRGRVLLREALAHRTPGRQHGLGRTGVEN